MLSTSAFNVILAIQILALVNKTLICSQRKLEFNQIHIFKDRTNHLIYNFNFCFN